jgi:hypothetical protein
MGKKKRYIHRAKKFAKKAFNFLDGLDGLRDSQLNLSTLDTLVTDITLVDRGNQTYALRVQGSGPGDSTGTANLQADKLKYSVDGTAVHSTKFLTFASASGEVANDRDNFLTNFLAPACAGAASTDVVLSGSSHEIAVQIMKENGTDALSVEHSKTLAMGTAKVDISAITAVKGLGTGVNGAATDEIALSASATIELGTAAGAGAAGEASGRAAGEESFLLGTGGAANDLKITLQTKPLVDVAFAQDEAGDDSVYTRADTNKTMITTTAVDPASGVIRINGTFSALVADNPHVMTIVPRKKDGTELTADAVTISIDLT